MKSKLDLLLILDETLLGSDNEENEDLAKLFHKALEESKKEN
ncbi:MAG: hypothetical protein ACRCX2_17740 [Paraclostridium sp.]